MVRRPYLLASIPVLIVAGCHASHHAPPADVPPAITISAPVSAALVEERPVRVASGWPAGLSVNGALEEWTADPSVVLPVGSGGARVWIAIGLDGLAVAA